MNMGICIQTVMASSSATSLSMNFSGLLGYLLQVPERAGAPHLLELAENCVRTRIYHVFRKIRVNDKPSHLHVGIDSFFEAQNESLDGIAVQFFNLQIMIS